MKKIFHTGLDERWNTFSLMFQMANIGAEVGRTISWTNKGNEEMSQNALYRALELIDFTVNDPKNRGCLGEILRMREVLVDYFTGENIYHSTDEGLNKYFYYFNFAARNF